jgi:hypothetical protein
MNVPTRSEAYTKLMHNLREAQDQAAILAHLHNTEGSDKDKALARGWLMISELFKRTQAKVTELAMGKLLQ